MRGVLKWNKKLRHLILLSRNVSKIITSKEPRNLGRKGRTCQCVWQWWWYSAGHVLCERPKNKKGEKQQLWCISLINYAKQRKIQSGTFGGWFYFILKPGLMLVVHGCLPLIHFMLFEFNFAQIKSIHKCTGRSRMWSKSLFLLNLSKKYQETHTLHIIIWEISNGHVQRLHQHSPDLFIHTWTSLQKAFCQTRKEDGRIFGEKIRPSKKIVEITMWRWWSNLSQTLKCSFLSQSQGCLWTDKP